MDSLACELKITDDGMNHEFKKILGMVQSAIKTLDETFLLSALHSSFHARRLDGPTLSFSTWSYSTKSLADASIVLMAC